jgi:hypothetical protein
MPYFKNYHLKIKEGTKTIFFFPVRDSEVERVMNGLKNKQLAGIDEIPDHVVKQCITLLKIPLTYFYNAFPLTLQRAVTSAARIAKTLHVVQ